MFGPHFDSQRWGQNATQSAAMSGTFFSLTSCLGSIDLRLAKVVLMAVDSNGNIRNVVVRDFHFERHAFAKAQLHTFQLHRLESHHLSLTYGTVRKSR